MSLNTAIEQSYLPEVEALTSLLFEFISRWKAASTLEQRLLIEAQAVSLFERLLQLEIDVEELHAGQHPELGEINDTYKGFTYLLRINIAKLKSLAQLYLSHFNTQQLSLMELVGRLKRIRQKHAALSLWNDEDARHIESEHFLNFDRLATDFQSLPQCDVDTNQGILTLPVRNKTPLLFQTARIGSKSNGNPGNSDLVVSTNNSNPLFAVNGEVDNWFEYERLDSGPCELTMVLELTQEQIVNQLTIEPVNLGNSLSFEVEDILFSTSNKTTISVHSLLSGNFEQDFFTVKSVGNDTAWTITFLPVQAKTISIKFKAVQAYQITTASGDRTERRVQRERYAIAIKTINAFKTQFDTAGGINSLEIPLPPRLFAAVPFLDIWPPSPDLFDLDLELSFDGGETWETSENIDDGIGSTILIDGTAASFLWRLRMERSDDSFATLESFLPKETLVPDIKTILRSASRFQSPTNIPLPEKPADNRVFVIQPRIARRGDRFNTISLGVGAGTDASYRLPFAKISNDLINSVRILVNGRVYTRNEDNAVLSAGEWAFSSDFRRIELTDSVPAGARIELALAKEKMLFEERSDGFYHKMGLLFDPDRRNIDVTYLPRNPIRSIEILPRSQTLINLNVTNILDDSFELISERSVGYVEVDTKTELLATPNGYLVDYPNGTIQLNEAFGADSVKASFLHQSSIALEREQFETVFVKNRPWGIKVSKSNFEATTFTETVGSTPGLRIDIVSGKYVARPDQFSTSDNTKTLTYDCLVKNSVVVSNDLLSTVAPPEEVGFINGRTEFFGLIEMENESTVGISTAPGERFVTFKLSAGGLWFKPFRVSFDGTVFTNLVSDAVAAETGSIGDYFVADDGLVTVNIGLNQTLPAGLKIVYSYRDPEFRPANKFSVDYANGILYSHRPLNPEATLTYKATCYKAGYDVAKQINAVEYNQTTNSVSVRTENLDASNNLVKVIWTKAAEATNFEELKDFFSPILSVIGFRMN